MMRSVTLNAGKENEERKIGGGGGGGGWRQRLATMTKRYLVTPSRRARL